MRRVAPILLLALACGSPSGESQGPPPLLTTLPRSLSAPEALVIGAGNQFGFSLFRQVRATAPDSNLFLSPFSASQALGMTLNGAAGTTLDSMRAALALGNTPLAELDASYQSLLRLLAGLDGTTEFRIANSIWSDAGFPFLPAFLDAARTSFDAEVRSLDLQAPASLDAINDWVHDKTNGKIPRILDQVRSDEVMFLINAIYFKGKWRLPFDPKRTRAAPFHAADGTTQSVPTMALEPSLLRYAADADHQAIELLYGNGAFAMTILLPGQGKSLAELAAQLDVAHWEAWTAALREVKLGLTLPRFRLEYKRELKDDLSALGMRIAFDDARADFSAMADPAAGRLFLSRVTQKTFVDVNEEGTEAAAATSVGIGVTSAPLTLEVNRPFLFVLRERLSGTIFFLGQVTRIP